MMDVLGCLQMRTQRPKGMGLSDMHMTLCNCASHAVRTQHLQVQTHMYGVGLGSTQPRASCLKQALGRSVLAGPDAAFRGLGLAVLSHTHQRHVVPRSPVPAGPDGACEGAACLAWGQRPLLCAQPEAARRGEAAPGESNPRGAGTHTAGGSSCLAGVSA